MRLHKMIEKEGFHRKVPCPNCGCLLGENDVDVNPILTGGINFNYVPTAEVLIKCAGCGEIIYYYAPSE